MKYVLALACLIGSLVPGAASAAMFDLSSCAGTAELGCVNYDSKTGSGITSPGTSANYSDDFGAHSRAFSEVVANEGELKFKAYAEASVGETFAEPRGQASVFINNKITPRGILGGFVSFNFILTGSKSGSSSVLASLLVTNELDPTIFFYQEIHGPGVLNLGNKRFSGFFDVAVSLSAEATAGKIGPLSSSAEASFGQSLTLASIMVYDTDGNLLNDVILDSESGYNYNPFLNQPFDASEVPEPSTMGLCAVAFAGLAALHRRHAA
jgi:hypothetical protein